MRRERFSSAMEAPSGVGDAHRGEQAAGLDARRLAAQAVGGERLGDLRTHAHHRVEAGGGLLEDHGQGTATMPAHGGFGQGQQVAAIEQHLPAFDPRRIGQQAHQGQGRHGFAAA